jgi:hypothetical protein
MHAQRPYYYFSDEGALIFFKAIHANAVLFLLSHNHWINVAFANKHSINKFLTPAL